ncbi:MAG: PolC-type DNA polymerase III [Geoalkalibacter sp.]|uniref:3'-5' exonuclease n=1 Tax=Geoalkalibacter sp. TaxID=3041440 RepID=UPI003D0E8C21
MPEKYVAVDVETIDLSPARGGRVIEIAAVAMEGPLIVEEYSTLINAPCRIHPSAKKVHGISRRMLADYPTPAEVWPKFLQFIEASPLVAHNARFDIGFLRHELALLGLPLVNRSHCTLDLARKHYAYLPNHRLSTVARHLLGDIPADCRLHRALGDARLAARVWMVLRGL